MRKASRSLGEGRMITFVSAAQYLLAPSNRQQTLTVSTLFLSISRVSIDLMHHVRRGPD
jgi:hypothetical protein